MRIPVFITLQALIYLARELCRQMASRWQADGCLQSEQIDTLFLISVRGQEGPKLTRDCQEFYYNRLLPIHIGSEEVQFLLVQFIRPIYGKYLGTR